MTPHSRGKFRIPFSLSAPAVVAEVGMMAMSIAGLWLATGWSLELLGQDPEVARLAQTYILARLPGVGGILWGLAAGLGQVAILLFFWTRWTSQQPLETLRVTLQWPVLGDGRLQWIGSTTSIEPNRRHHGFEFALHSS